VLYRSGEFVEGGKESRRYPKNTTSNGYLAEDAVQESLQ
jgi:hypothetical protein